MDILDRSADKKPPVIELGEGESVTIVFKGSDYQFIVNYFDKERMQIIRYGEGCFLNPENPAHRIFYRSRVKDYEVG